MEITDISMTKCVIIDSMNGFTAWLNDTIRSRGWSISELARRSGFSQSLASDVLNEKADPSANFVISVANALGESPEALLRLAGHLPDAPPVTSVSQAVCEAFRRLDARHQSAVSEIVFALAGMPRAENAPAVSVPSRSGQTPVGEGEIDDLASATFDAEHSTPAYIDQERELRLIFEHIMEGFVSRIPVGEREERLQQWVLNWVGKREREVTESRQ